MSVEIHFKDGGIRDRNVDICHIRDSRGFRTLTSFSSKRPTCQPRLAANPPSCVGRCDRQSHRRCDWCAPVRSADEPGAPVGGHDGSNAAPIWTRKETDARVIRRCPPPNIALAGPIPTAKDPPTHASCSSSIFALHLPSRRRLPDDTGVLVEFENVGLSRTFPPMLAWIIEPIARRVGRSSVDDSLSKFREGVLAAHQARTRHQKTDSRVERSLNAEDD